MVRRQQRQPSTRLILTTLTALILAACGGGGGSDSSNVQGGGTTVPPTAAPETKSESFRFFKQASFGATGLQAENLLTDGYQRWINQQFASRMSSMREYIDARLLADPEASARADWVYEAFWKNVATGEDQLRQRVTYALSQIFVISMQDASVSKYPRGVAHYYDLLASNAFGNFRDLLEDVALNPMMGIYLTHLANEKGDPETGRVPDENFAREIMQLFSLGLYELNLDGSVKLGGDGKPIETYDTADVEGMAKVFTGLSWGGPDTERSRFKGWNKYPGREVLKMQAYPQYHSTEEKRFLGVVIPEGSSDALADVRIALDTLFNHPNVGPFIARQMIQRLVMSNPSPAYVARVAAQFNDNGEGTRGDMRALVKAILFDEDARSLEIAALPSSGKIREPILRFAEWMRAFRAVSTSGRFSVGNTDDQGNRLGQTVLRSPSVFNFYRPGYVPPNTPIADASLVSPEMQITHETSVAGWLNMMRSAVDRGWGTSRDIKPNYEIEISMADNPAELVERINIILLNGTMSNRLRSRVQSTVGDRQIHATDAARAQRDRADRVHLAVFMTMASPEFAVLQ